MNLKLRLHLLQHLSTQEDEIGSTWIWLLAIIGIIGVIAAIAIPNMSKCGPNKAVLAEAKSAIGTMNRSQQAYYLEYATFAKSIKELQVGIREQTEHYNYSIQAQENIVFNYAIARHEYAHFGWFSKRPVKSYVGGVFIYKDPKTSEGLTLAITCESNLPGLIKPAKPTMSKGVPTCGKGTTPLTR
ncbi:MAG TPA: type IV pilin-like G/H family protein [Nostocaceae cyanobacterium]|nr:type IV pilin-like G/H family protein [Nostocaceae cyanobacterium]